MNLKFNGNTPLKGQVSPAGSVFSAINIISCSLLFEKAIIRNVPRVLPVEETLARVTEAGAAFSWMNDSTIEVTSTGSGATLDYSQILLAPVLARMGTYRFSGKPAMPKETKLFFESFGVNFNEEGSETVVTFGGEAAKTVSVEHSLEFSLAALILATRFPGGVRLTDFLMVEETLDLIDFLKAGGLSITSDPKTPGEIKTTGSLSSSAVVSYSIPPSAIESLFWASSAVLSFGDIVIKAAPRERLVSFLSKFTALGVHYDIDGENLRVWQDEGHPLTPIDFEITKKMPLYDFLPLLLPVLLKATGTSYVRGISLDDESYIKELNLFNAKIVDGMLAGPVVFKGCKVALSDFSSGLSVILAAVGSNGRSEILEAEKVCNFIAALPGKLEHLLGVPV